MNQLCRRMAEQWSSCNTLPAVHQIPVILNLRCWLSVLFACLGLVAAGPLQAAPSVVQTATFSRQPTASGTVTLPFLQATGVGHTLIVGVSFWPLDVTSVTDGSGDTFTRGLGMSIDHDVAGSSTYSNFYYAKSTAGGTKSLTLTFSGGSTYLFVSVAEVAGLDPSAPLDQSGFHDSLTPTAAWSSAGVTTTAANEYLFSWGATAAAKTVCSSPASGWTIESQTDDPAGATVCLLDRIVSATGAYQASLSTSPAANYAMEIVTFQSASSSPPPSPAPVLTSVNPNSGTQGQTLTSIVLTGSNFQSGDGCNFGSGITVNSCTFNSATQLTASIAISATAAAGARSVTVTGAGGQSSTLANSFTITTAGPAPAPVLSGVNPNSGSPGQALTSVILTGSNFQSGATCNFGTGITVNSCSFNSATQLTASISISASAATGARNVAVTNPDGQSSTLSNAFSVTAPPAISVIQKATYSQQPTAGGTVTLMLPQATGAGHTLIVGVTFWPQDITSVTDGSGDTFTRGLASNIGHEVYGSVTFTNFYYAKSTAGGTTSLTLSFNGGNTYLLVAVAEVAGLNSSSPFDQSKYHESLTPTTAWSSAAVTTTGANEYLFSWGATTSASVACSSPASGWTIESQNVDSTGATVCLLDRVAAATGSYQASVNASPAEDYAMEIVSFQSGSSAPSPPSPAPVLTSLNPNSGAEGTTLSLLLNGNNFQSGAVCLFGAGVNVNSCTFNSATQITANVSIITARASVGAYNVTVTNPDGQASTLTNGFNVTAAGSAPAPTLTSVNPNSGTQGQTVTGIVLTGSNFQSGTVCSFGAGITVNSCAFNSATQLTASIAISSSATAGARSVTVTNPGSQSSTLTNGFTVTTAGPPPAPTLTSINPNAGAPGQTLASVVLTGSNFQSGATCSFGSGITVNSCNFSSATQLTASIAISSSASTGTRDVTVTNPGNESSTLSSAFTVTSSPAISVIQKATFSRQPTAGGTVTLTLPQATGAGHTLIVGVSFWPLDITSVSDGSGDIFTRGLATPSAHQLSGSTTFSNFYYAKVTGGGATSLTLNFSGGSTYLLVAVAEVAGLNTSTPLDQSGFHDSLTPTTAWSSAAVTTTTANEYLFSWGATVSADPVCSSPASGWTIESQTNDPSGATVCLLDRIVSATGPYQASVNASSAQDYAMEIVTFH